MEPPTPRKETGEIGPPKRQVETLMNKYKKNVVAK